ncbi:MAG: hypothetical protein ACM3ZA_03125 [Bacillota bacterium]
MAWWEWALATNEHARGRAHTGNAVTRQGWLGGVAWEARVTVRPVSYGLNPRTLLKGQGRVARLVVYQQIGRAQVPHKLAVYDRGWRYGRKRHLVLIQRIMSELERDGAV